MGRLYYPQARVILSVVFDGFGPTARDTPPLIVPVIPKTVTITRNAYNQADGWEIVFDADDLPIDPQMVKAGAVEIFLFQTTGLGPDARLIDRPLDDQEAPEQRSPRETALQEVGAVSSVERFTFGAKPQIAGLFDEQSWELSSNGRWCSITGQDYTALLLERQWPPLPNGRARRIPVGRRLDRILAEILRQADDTGRLTLAIENVKQTDLPIVRADLVNHRRGIPVAADTSYWDVMSKVAARYGFILFVRGLDVVLTTPKNLTDDKDIRIRQMVWGKNLETLELTRYLGKETVPTIVIKAYDKSLKRPIEVDFPEGSFAKVKRTPRKGREQNPINIRKTEEYRIVPVYGVTDRAALKRAAESLYNRLGRAERTVRFSTRDLSDQRDASLLDLASGDAVSVEFDEFNIDRALLSNEKKPEEEKFQHLLTRGFGEAVARVIAQKYVQLEALKRPLRVREVTYEYDVETGVSIEVEAQDFVVVDGARDRAEKEARKDRRRNRRDGTRLARASEQGL